MAFIAKRIRVWLHSTRLVRALERATHKNCQEAHSSAATHRLPTTDIKVNEFYLQSCEEKFGSVTALSNSVFIYTFLMCFCFKPVVSKPWAMAHQWATKTFQWATELFVIVSLRAILTSYCFCNTRFTLRLKMIVNNFYTQN